MRNFEWENEKDAAKRNATAKSNVDVSGYAGLTSATLSVLWHNSRPGWMFHVQVDGTMDPDVFTCDGDATSLENGMYLAEEIFGIFLKSQTLKEATE